MTPLPALVVAGTLAAAAAFAVRPGFGEGSGIRASRDRPEPAISPVDSRNLGHSKNGVITESSLKSTLRELRCYISKLLDWAAVRLRSFRVAIFHRQAHISR